MVQSQSDFTGVWQVNFEKSTLRGQPPKQILMKIEHQEPKLIQSVHVIHETGHEERLTFTYETTGNETANPVGGGTARCCAQWIGRELVIESWMKTPGREFHFKDHWSLSDDGRTLTMAHRDDDLAGQISVLEKAPPQAATTFDKLQT